MSQKLLHCFVVSWICHITQDRQKRAIVQPQATTKPVLAVTTLWVNGLSTDTKAADLKMLFIKYGKVPFCVPVFALA